MNQATNLAIRTVKSSWAGLRTFSPDGDIVLGFDPDAGGFFWLVGLGGTGIQTSPAAGLLGADLILARGVSSKLTTHGVGGEIVSPGRFRS